MRLTVVVTQGDPDPLSNQVRMTLFADGVPLCFPGGVFIQFAAMDNLFERIKPELVELPNGTKYSFS